MPRTIFTGLHSVLVRVLVERRKEVGLKQEDLAQRLGRNQSHISLIERGQRRIDVVEFVRIAAALDSDPAFLLQKVVRLGEGDED